MIILSCFRVAKRQLLLTIHAYKYSCDLSWLSRTDGKTKWGKELSYLKKVETETDPTEKSYYEEHVSYFFLASFTFFSKKKIVYKSMHNVYKFLFLHKHHSVLATLTYTLRLSKKITKWKQSLWNACNNNILFECGRRFSSVCLWTSVSSRNLVHLLFLLI